MDQIVKAMPEIWQSLLEIRRLIVHELPNCDKQVIDLYASMVDNAA